MITPNSPTRRLLGGDSRRQLLGGANPKPRTSDDAAQGAAGSGRK